MKNSVLPLLFSIVIVFPALGQINQISPEVCGTPNIAVPLPPNIRATLDPSTGEGSLYIGVGDTSRKISLPGVVNEVDEVCPLKDGRLAVFAFAEKGGLGEVYLINRADGSLLDYLWGFAPAMSPNQRWLVYRKFYPARTELPVSEEYLLYDLTKSPAQNRPPGIALSDYANVGSAIFPVGQKNLEGDNIELLPPEQQHGVGSGYSGPGFFWAPDSRAVAFGDFVQQKLSIVLVTLDAQANTTASVYPVSLAGRCSPPIASNQLAYISRIDVGNKEVNDRPIRIDFWSGDEACSPKSLDIRSSDYQPPKAEIHIRSKRFRSVVDPQ